VGILGSSRAGWLLYLAHTAASLTVGMLFRFYRHRGTVPALAAGTGTRAGPPSHSPIPFTNAFIKSVKTSFESVFYISAFVIFFTAVIRLLFTSGALPAAASWLGSLFAPLGLTADMAKDLLTGLIELTSGLFSVRDDPTAGLVGKMAMAAFMLGWAGLSVNCQVLSFIGQSGLSSRTYLLGKAFHAAISALYAFLLAGPMGLNLPVTETIAEQVETIARLRFTDTLSVTLTAISALALFAAGAAAWKLWKKTAPPVPPR
jgi:hypothetical protein